MYTYTHNKISGSFVKVIENDQENIVLSRNYSDRPEARYNRRGQDALYLSVDEYSARVAMRKYKREMELPLYLVEYEVEACLIVDLRQIESRELKKMASQDWKSELTKGVEPTSWQVSDMLRKNYEVGVIDPSRKNPKVWHLALFRWNESGAPKVCRIGDPKPILL